MEITYLKAECYKLLFCFFPDYRRTRNIREPPPRKHAASVLENQKFRNTIENKTFKTREFEVGRYYCRRN